MTEKTKENILRDIDVELQYIEYSAQNIFDSVTEIREMLTKLETVII